MEDLPQSLMDSNGCNPTRKDTCKVFFPSPYKVMIPTSLQSPHFVFTLVWCHFSKKNQCQVFHRRNWSNLQRLDSLMFSKSLQYWNGYSIGHFWSKHHWYLNQVNTVQKKLQLNEVSWLVIKCYQIEYAMVHWHLYQKLQIHLSNPALTCSSCWEPRFCFFLQ